MTRYGRPGAAYSNYECLSPQTFIALVMMPVTLPRPASYLTTSPSWREIALHVSHEMKGALDLLLALQFAPMASLVAFFVFLVVYTLHQASTTYYALYCATEAVIRRSYVLHGMILQLSIA